MNKMIRGDLLLAGMSPARTEPYTPVQIQKLFFILDKELSKELQGPHFDFQPYNYGPFDRDVYSGLEELSKEGLVEIVGNAWTTNRVYRLTEKGLEKGAQALKTLPEKVQHYVGDVSETVRRLSFAQLVSAVYKRYPEMKANSVFKS